MIYKKEANFPYPLLTNTSDSYEQCQFLLDIDLHESTEDYHFIVKSEIESSFLKKRIQTGQAKLILIIQSKDSKFYPVKLSEDQVTISKKRLSLSKRTTLQLIIQAATDINFTLNNDLAPFYDEIKDEITVTKHSVLGFSNCVLFNGSTNKPFDLFEKRLNPELKSEIAIELGSETIIIHYQNEVFQFNDSSHKEILNHPYIYMGLQRALYRFIIKYGEDEQVYLEDVEDLSDELDFKLYHLMKSKGITELDTETIDEVIAQISDRMLEKFTQIVGGLYKDED